MNRYQYDNLRAFAMESLTAYMGTDFAYDVAELAEAINGDAGGLVHQKHRAMDFLNCRDLTPTERAAAWLLAAISNHRRIAWWREAVTPDGSEPAPALEPEQSAQLCNETLQAATAYAAFLPERQAEALLALVPEPQAATPAPVADSASHALEIQSTPMKKAALIAALEHEWPSIEADLGEATRNGLKDAAHTGKHGEWDREKARVWAVRKNKIKQAAPVHHLAKWPGTVTRNQS